VFAATIILASLSMGFQTGQPRGTGIAVFTVDGGKLKGEILAVRDSALVFATPAWLSEEGLAAGRGNIRVIPFAGIVSVTTVTGTHPPTGDGGKYPSRFAFQHTKRIVLRGSGQCTRRSLRVSTKLPACRRYRYTPLANLDASNVT